MFTAKKPRALALTLIFYIALALILATGSDAKGYAPVPLHRRDHFNLNRLIRKRAPQPQDGGGLLGGGGNKDAGPVIGAGAEPPTDASTTSTASSTSVQSVPTSSDTPTSSKSTPTTSSSPPALTSSSSSSSASDPLSLSSVVSSLTNTGSSSSTPLSTLSSSSSPLLSSSSSTALLTSIAATTTPSVVTTPTPTSAHVTVTTQASDASASASAAPTASSSKITRTTLTVLIVIASCVGGTAIIWTIIRKWKLRTSSQFDERMRPIDWQPTTSEDNVPGHHRAGSSASSFHSGSGHDGLGDGYGSTIDHGRSPSPLPPIPDHDFTAGPTSLAPIGGYADLARGPSPRPQMQEALTRGPSLARPQYDQYGVPLHHQGGYGSDDPYEYNGARY